MKYYAQSDSFLGEAPRLEQPEFITINEDCEMPKATMHKNEVRRAYQKGAVLIISMIMLLILTLLALTGIQSSIVENRMSSNITDVNRSFQATESALREGEAYVLNLTTLPTPVASCGTSVCILTNDPTRQASNQSTAWWTSNSAMYSSSTLTSVSAPPRYIIEFNDFVPDSLGFGSSTGRYYYSITARGTGQNSSSVVILQSTVMKRF